MKDFDVPEVGKTYIDIYEESKTLGDEYTCVEIREGKLWESEGYMMKHLKTGEIDKFQSFGWKISE